MANEQLTPFSAPVLFYDTKRKNGSKPMNGMRYPRINGEYYYNGTAGPYAPDELTSQSFERLNRHRKVKGIAFCGLTTEEEVLAYLKEKFEPQEEESTNESLPSPEPSKSNDEQTLNEEAQSPEPTPLVSGGTSEEEETPDEPEAPPVENQPLSVEDVVVPEDFVLPKYNDLRSATSRLPVRYDSLVAASQKQDHLQKVYYLAHTNGDLSKEG